MIDMNATNEPWSLSLQKAAAQIRARQLSVVELTESVLRRIAETEPVIHAYVTVLAQEALAAAHQADEELSAGHDRGPLHGLPIGIKDLYDVAGVPTRCGSRVREHAAPAAVDSVSVARLRAAGMIIIGKTVTQEFAAGVVSPPTRNPWDPTRIPGGSSGGSGAAVAAGSALAAMGSDTGGSIRIPASVNGVVGLKPTYGLISKRGVFPLSWSLDTLGPLTQTVADSALIVDALAGYDPLDPTSSPHTSSKAMTEIGQSLRGLRIGVIRTFFFDRLQAGVSETVEQAIERLKETGAEVIDTPWSDASLARAAGYVINRAETIGVHGRGLREHPDLFGPELRLRLEASALFPAESYIHGQRARARVKGSMAALFRDQRFDAIVVPTLPATALPADDLVATYADGSREPVSVAYTRFTMPFNATGQPALSVPCGFDPRGLPVGLQIVGRPFDEARLCRIGHAFEQVGA